MQEILHTQFVSTFSLARHYNDYLAVKLLFCSLLESLLLGTDIMDGPRETGTSTLHGKPFEIPIP